MSALRAYLSGPGGQLRREPLGSFSRPDWYKRDRAIHEAYRILAQAERDLPGTYYGQHPGCYTSSDGIYCASCMNPEPAAALAESLAAFLAMEVA